jgi:nitroreductase/NAD-dependent dihydropyrimidine dehydrogenase PreA subunit
MIRILPDRCTRCGLCVDDCVSRVFRMHDRMPVVVHPELCNRCSHCLAVCPSEAVIHDGLGGSVTPRIDRRKLRADVYREIALSRRSVRRYKPDPVPRETVERILDVARYAPTASNAQNVQYTIVSRRSLLEEVSRRIFRFGDRIYRLYTLRTVQQLRGMLPPLEFVRSLDRYAENWNDYREQVEHGRDLILHHAPVLLLLHTPRGQAFGRDNCMITAAHIDSYAHALGLGTCFIGILTTALQLDRALQGKLGVPQGHRVHAAMTLGVPAVRYTHHVVRNAPRVHWLSEDP